jgi:hypothetical protein
MFISFISSTHLADSEMACMSPCVAASASSQGSWPGRNADSSTHPQNHHSHSDEIEMH